MLKSDKISNQCTPIYKVEKINKELAMFGVDHNINITDPLLKVLEDYESIVHHDHCTFRIRRLEN